MRWLLLRGLAREQRHWLDFPAVLESALPGARVYLLDLPGAGTEHARRSPHTIAAIAEDVRARWKTLDAAGEGPWGLLGMSLGGMVAMDWCATHPKDFARVVLVSTSAGGLSRWWRRFDPRVLPLALAAMGDRDAVRREKRILAISSRLIADTTEVAGRWGRFSQDRPMQRSNVLRQLAAGRAFRAPAALLTPALIVAGAGDRLTDVSCSKSLASRFGARLVIHPGAGHEIALDAPTWLGEQIAAG